MCRGCATLLTSRDHPGLALHRRLSGRTLSWHVRTIAGMPNTDDAPAFPWSPELLQAPADYFAAYAEPEALERPTFVDDYPPGVLEQEQELRAKGITASERIHADPF